MALGIRRGSAAGERPQTEIRELRDDEAISRFLRTRRAYAAYALGQLEPALFRRTQWWVAKGPFGQALVLHSRGGLGAALLAMGERTALDAIMSLHPGPRTTYATCQPEHLDVLKKYYDFSSETPMMRMAVTANTFQPADGETVRLHGYNVPELNRLYSSEGNYTYYSERHIEEGLYRGVVVDGRLVAVAGTHVISRAQGVAVVGNVFTHPHYRGAGFATLATSAVTTELLEFCPDVVLTVDPNNTPAVRAYLRLGYRDDCRLIEGVATRKDLVALGSGFRRFGARVRGRRNGVEIINN
ncbi:MAG: GNAT family N-acetyltransferase [Dehalococcoidia bacterium]|nr:GNAT family N-acetyltransferase [Dehalococcoidia bacterium]